MAGLPWRIASRVKAARATAAVPQVGPNLVIRCDRTEHELGGAQFERVCDVRNPDVLKRYMNAKRGDRPLAFYTPGVGMIDKVDFYYRWEQRLVGLIGLSKQRA